MDFLKRNAGIIAALSIVLTIGVAIFGSGKVGPQGPQGPQGIGAASNDSTSSTKLAPTSSGDYPVEWTSTSAICNDATSTLAVFPNPFGATSTVRFALADFSAGLSTTSQLRLFVGTTSQPTAFTSYSNQSAANSPYTANGSTTIASKTNLINGLNIGKARSNFTLPFVTNLLIGATTSLNISTGSAYLGTDVYYASSTPMDDANAAQDTGPMGDTVAGGGVLTAQNYLNSLWGSTSPSIQVGPNQGIGFFVDDRVNNQKAATVDNGAQGSSKFEGIVGSYNTLGCTVKVSWYK